MEITGRSHLPLLLRRAADQSFAPQGAVAVSVWLLIMSRQDIHIGAERDVDNRQMLSIYSHDDEGCVQFLTVDMWGDVHSISFPRENAPAVIAALQTIADAEGAV